MDRRTLIVSGLVTLGAAAAAKAEPIQLPPAKPRTAAQPSSQAAAPPPPNTTPAYPTGAAEPPPPPGKAATYTEDEIVNSVSDFLGVTAEAAGGAVERVF